jgi:hypothetical protein
VITALLREPLHHTRANAVFEPGVAESIGHPGLFLRIDVTFADGVTVSNAREPSRETRRQFLAGRGRTVNGGRFEQRYWSAPLPPVGPLRISCHWPDFAVAETHDIDAELINAGAKQAVVPWPS